MHELSKRFQEAFKRIESQLKIICNVKQHPRFAELINRAAVINPIVRHSQMILRTFGNLRNSLVHERHELAVPTEQTVLQIEGIADFLDRPPKLADLFAMSIETCDVNDSVAIAAQKMYDKSYSQIPVIDGKRLVGLLTTETITRWVAARFMGGETITGEPISTVLKYKEHDAFYKLISRQASVFDALEQFDQRSQDLDALLVTETGSTSEDILGIVTPYDVPRLIRESLHKLR